MSIVGGLLIILILWAIWWIAPLLMPYALARMVYTSLEKKAIVPFLWFLLLVLLSLPLLDDLGLMSDDWGLSDLGEYKGVYQAFFTVFIPANVFLWWYVWHRDWSKDIKSLWRTSAIPALILSIILAFHYSPALTWLVIILLGVYTYSESQRLQRMRLLTLKVPEIKWALQPSRVNPRGVEFPESRSINELGYRQFPGAVDVNIALDSGNMGRSVRIDFRSSATPEEILDFYEASTRDSGLRPRRGRRIADYPDRSPVPALVATANEPVAFVIARDTFDEFGWHITVWTKTWGGFHANLKAYFKFDDEDSFHRDESVDLSGYSIFKDPIPEVPLKKPPTEYGVFQQRVDEKRFEPPVTPPAPEIPPIAGPAMPQVIPSGMRGPRMEDQPIAEPAMPRGMPRAPKKPFDWGEFVETYLPVWGMFVGVSIIVLATGYFLIDKYDLVGKVITAYAFFAAFFVMGTRYEQRPLFTTFGKTLIAGAWGGFYITTYLIYYLPEARVIRDPVTATLLLIIISVGMIIHSFKYKSELLTTLTYVVAFISVAMSAQMTDHMTYSLIASSILAISMVFILYRMQWFRLAIFAMAGTYLTHAVWLYPITDAFKWTGITGFEFSLGAIMLIFYWFIFSLAVYFYEPKNQKEEAFNLWMNALNYSLFYLVFQYQLGPDNPVRIWLVESLALAYVGLIFLSHYLKRENLYFHNLVLAVLSTTMALYYHLLGGNWVTMGWLIQAEALYFVGLLGDDKRYRNVAFGIFMLIGVWMVSHDYTMGDKVLLFGFWLYKRTIIAVTVAAFFYLNAALRHKMASRIQNEEGYSYLFSYAASVLWLIVMVRNWYPDHLVHAGYTSAILAFILMEIGIRLNDAHFRIQGLFFAFISVLAALFPMLAADTLYYTEGVLYRIIFEAIVVLLAYTVFYRYQKKISEFDADTRGIEFTIGMFSSVAAVLAVVLLHREFSVHAPLWLVLGWMVLGILLVEMGLMLRNAFFRAQGYVITGIAMVWALYSMLLMPSWFEPGITNFIAQILVVFGFFWLFGRLLAASRRDDTAFTDGEISEGALGAGPLLSIFFSIAGTLILILTIQRELGSSHPLFISVLWMFVAVALLEAGIVSLSKPLRWQAWTVAGFAFIYALFFNLVPGPYIGPFSSRLLSLSLIIIGFYYIFSRLTACERSEKGGLDWPDGVNIFSWLAATLLVLVIQKELWIAAPAWVGTAWLVPMIAFLIAGLRRSSRNFIVQAIVLSSIIFFWTLLIPVAGMFGSEHSETFESLRIYATIPVILIFYLVFGYIISRGPEYGGDKLNAYLAHFSDVIAWWAGVLLVSLITREVGGPHAGITTVVWITLALIYHWVGKRIGNSTLELQGYTLATASFIRTMLVNLDYPLVPGSVPSALIVAVSLYYMWFTVKLSKRNPTIFNSEQLASAMSYLGAAVIMCLLFMVIDDRTWVPAAWGGFSLLILLIAIMVGDRRFAFKAVVMASVTALSVVIFDFFVYEKVPWKPAGIAIACLYIARIVLQFGIDRIITGVSETEAEEDFYRNSMKHYLSIPASILLLALLFLKFRGPETMYMTLGFALEAFLLTMMGFALKDRFLRVTALCILAFSVIKLIRELFVIDPHTFPKFIPLAGVGAVLLITGWLYSSRLELKRKKAGEE